MDTIDRNEFPPAEDTKLQRKVNKKYKTVSKIIALNKRNNTIGVIMNGFGVIIPCRDVTHYCKGDMITVIHEGVLGLPGFRILGVK